MGNRKNIVIIDYGMGNTWSVISAIKYLNINCELTNDKKKIQNADAIILPGVGSFKKGILNLKKFEIFDLLKKEILFNKKKILGICLGFQLLGISSTEDGLEEGLNLIPAKVEKFKHGENEKFKIPHIGFNSVDFNKNDKLFLNLKENSDFYFVHSYRFKLDNLEGFIASSSYGEKFISAYHKENIFGTQFHPEKSQSNGIKLLQNFFDF